MTVWKYHSFVEQWYSQTCQQTIYQILKYHSLFKKRHSKTFQKILYQIPKNLRICSLGIVTYESIIFVLNNDIIKLRRSFIISLRICAFLLLWRLLWRKDSKGFHVDTRFICYESCITFYTCPSVLSLQREGFHREIHSRGYQDSIYLHLHHVRHSPLWFNRL